MSCHPKTLPLPLPCTHAPPPSGPVPARASSWPWVRCPRHVAGGMEAQVLLRATQASRDRCVEGGRYWPTGGGGGTGPLGGWSINPPHLEVGWLGWLVGWLVTWFSVLLVCCLVYWCGDACPRDFCLPATHAACVHACRPQRAGPGPDFESDGHQRLGRPAGGAPRCTGGGGHEVRLCACTVCVGCVCAVFAVCTLNATVTLAHTHTGPLGPQ